MNHAEQVAQVVLKAALDGARLHYREDQSTSVHDFDLVLSGGVDAVEVTTSTDPSRRATVAAIMDARKGGQFVPTHCCRKDWLVHPVSGANIDLIRRRVDEYLAAIEVDGLERFFSPVDADAHQSVWRIYEDLSIEGGGVLRWNPPGRIGISTPSGGGVVGAEHFVRAIEHEAIKDDNRRKLRAATARQRHLFVYVDPHAFLPWIVLIDQDPPATPPSLPEEVDVVWAATEAIGTRDRYVVWQGRSAAPWRSLGVIP